MARGGRRPPRKSLVASCLGRIGNVGLALGSPDTNGRAILVAMGKGDQTRGTILDAALDVASTVGLEALSIGRLAERVGLSKSGLFAHFRSKEALQLEVLEHARADFIQGVVAPAGARD